VTIYGTLDASAGSAKRTLSETGETSSTQTVSTLGGLNSSRGSNVLGFRGTEDLGGGLTASFTYEFGLNGNNVANNGNATSAAAGTPHGNGSPFGQTRQAWIGFGSKSMGEVRVGSQNTIVVPLRGMSATIQDANVGGSFLSQLQGTATTRNPVQLIAAGDTFAAQNSTYLTPTTGVTSTQPRYSNVLSYTTPTMSGLRGGLAVVRESSENGAGMGIAAAQTKTSGQILSVEFDQGPLSIKGAYTNKSLRTLAAENEVTSYALAGSYNLGMAIPYAIYEAGENDVQRAAGAASTEELSTKGYEIGARFPMGAFTPFISYGKGTWENTEVGAATVQVKGKMYQLGTTYSMSKRTTLYAALGSSKWTGSVVGQAGSAADHLRGYRLGVTHAF
jgi:predicted porin